MLLLLLLLLAIMIASATQVSPSSPCSSGSNHAAESRAFAANNVSSASDEQQHVMDEMVCDVML